MLKTKSRISTELFDLFTILTTKLPLDVKYVEVTKKQNSNFVGVMEGFDNRNKTNVFIEVTANYNKTNDKLTLQLEYKNTPQGTTQRDVSHLDSKKVYEVVRTENLNKTMINLLNQIKGDLVRLEKQGLELKYYDFGHNKNVGQVSTLMNIFLTNNKWFAIEAVQGFEYNVKLTGHRTKVYNIKILGQNNILFTDLEKRKVMELQLYQEIVKLI